MDAAYAVQAALVQRRLTAGERLVGLKMGLTSKAKMAQMGVDEVIWGRLTDAMRVPDGGSVDVGATSSTRGSSRRWRSCWTGCRSRASRSATSPTRSARSPRRSR